jgi:hypothetical protein
VQWDQAIFRHVHRGTWANRHVVVKCVVSRDAFTRERDVWRRLRHENVLELLAWYESQD